MTAPSIVRARFSHPGKDLARALVVELASGDSLLPTGHGVETVLDLWGGGASARAIVGAVPGVALTSCETDLGLWPALRLDAQQHGYVPWCGDFRTATGRYDLIWLDLCSQWSRSAREDVKAASRMLTENGTLVVTLLAAREDPLSADDRLFMVPLGLERATGLRVDTVFPYQTESPMWLLMMHRYAGPFRYGYADDPKYFDRPSSWSLEPSQVPMPSEYGRIPFAMVMEDWERDGYFTDRAWVPWFLEEGYREKYEAIAA